MSQMALKINIFHAYLHFSVSFSDSTYETPYSQGFILVHDGISSYNNYVHIPTSKREEGGGQKNTNKQTNKQKKQEMGLTHSLPISIVAKVTDAYFPVS